MKMGFHMTQLTVICANISGLLFNMNLSGIAVHHIRIIDELTASFCIPQHDYRSAANLVNAAGGRILNSISASYTIVLKSLLRRPALIFFSALILLMTIFLPTRLLFVRVTGNEHLTQQEILETASNCGIKFGAVRREIRSEQVKNRLLAELPDLKWVGVNTRGCVALISVQERGSIAKEPNISMVSSIVATCDGIIQSITVENGNPLCKVGQAVKRGQLLVSGYSDCGRCIYGTRANAEIYAQTKHTLSNFTLTNYHAREQKIDCKKKIGLIIGKKRINFYKGSGISDTTCVRMYMEYPLVIPGGFQLPVSFYVQKETSYASMQTVAAPLKAEAIMKHASVTYLDRQMIAGRIIQENHQIIEADGVAQMLSQYICEEMISQTRNEEIRKNYEQAD